MIPGRFRWIEKRILAASAMPGLYNDLSEDIDFLMENQIGTVVSLTEDPLPPVLFNSAGIKLIHMPVVDFSVPTFEQADDFIKIVQQHYKTQFAVLVHCWAGMGRTGLMVACYFAWKNKISGAEAIELARLIDQRYIQSLTQEKFVIDWANKQRGYK